MARMIPCKETLTIEFKSDIKKYGDNDLFEDVVAFANTEGGHLYLGVEDDGTITGVHPEHANPVTLGAYIANNTVPPISTRCEIIEEEKPVLKITVPKSYGGIAATRSGKILRRRIKIDNTPENIPMYPTEIATRLSDLRLLDYSAMLVLEGSLDDIDPLELERLRRIVLAYHGDKALLELDDGELLRALGFTRAQNDAVYPTIAGILMVGKVSSIEKFVPTGRASFQVLEGTGVRVNEDYALPVLAAIEKIVAHMEAWNPEQELEMGLFRMSVPEFDKRALREAIVNAFCHRDYSIMGRVRVAITDEGLTIANPGGFIEGVTIQNLLTAEPHGRNPLLADALKRVGLAEKTGRGIDRIYEGSLIYGRHLPDYSNSTPKTVSLFIPRSKPDVQLVRIISDEQNRLGRPLPINTLLVLNTLREIPRSDVKQIAEAANLSGAIVKTVLDKAVENGLVEAYGAGRGRSYMLSHKLYQDKTKTMGYVRQKDIDEARYLEMIVNMARENEFIARADVVNLLHVNEDKAYNLLKALTKQGILAMVNKGRYAKYRLNSK
ncbi:MAG: RNA-binding domain-containing protein [Butyricicoccaceae bacterium]